MPPRKRNAVSSAAARKSNQGQLHLQPSKFGIQHFFERHSQSQAAASANAQNQSNPGAKLNPKSLADDPPEHHPPKPDAAPADADEGSSQISPEVTKSVASKRFKFSPGMLIRQSQDDGGDVVTWRISPVNERLRSISSKQRLQGSIIHPCSLKQGLSSSNGIFEKFSLSLSRQTLSEESETYDSNVNNDNPEDACITDLKRPFQTPPSMPYGPKEFVGGASCNGKTKQLGQGPQVYQKALLELLDQVEDVITDEPLLCNPNKSNIEVAEDAKAQSDHSSRSFEATHERDLDFLSYDTFIVVKVSEEHESNDSCRRGPVKILDLLNLRTDEMQTLHLYDEWFYSLIKDEDIINVLGDFGDNGRCIVDHDKNLVIVHPDILLSGTRVASSFSCPRRAVLDERLKSSEHSSAALLGTLLHEIFQAGLLEDMPSRKFLEDYAGVIMRKYIESLYACGANEKDMFLKIVESIPRILNWLTCFIDKEGHKRVPVDFGGYSEDVKDVCITEVIDIEEMVQAPRYGLKGIIDASVRVRITSSKNERHETIMPLEFKTGKGNRDQIEHCAQVILYTLLMSERYLKKDLDSGLLYYMQMDHTQGIKVQRSKLIGLIMRRNELASEILMASKTQNLPPMIQNLTMCKFCRHLNACTIYHKAYGGSSDTSGLGDLFENLVDHLTVSHCNFLKHWVHLVDLEAQESKINKRRTGSLTYILVDFKNESLGERFITHGRYIYNFVRSGQNSSLQGDSSDPRMSNLDSTLGCGDYVVLSTKNGCAVASGVVTESSQSKLSVSFPRRLRLPGYDGSIEKGRLIQEVWRINRDESVSSFSSMRFNLLNLFAQNSQCEHLRRMIVDHEAPSFVTGDILSQDPALSYIRSEKNLNDDQKESIERILAAKDYTLVLGMPGTGKTSIMVYAVKALLMGEASILLTSYTNLAIDNLLIKLKSQGIDFVRIGRREAIHADIHEYCISGMNSVDDIREKMEHARVVGVTCSGINHSLLVNKKFDICIMDEAGQITLPVSLGPLMLASRFVLVGDDFQLPPLVQSEEARNNGMGTSLFRKLAKKHSGAQTTLQYQYRMCSGIMELPNALIYENRLRCGSAEVASARLKFSCCDPISLWLQEIVDQNRPVVFVNTDKLPVTKEQKNHRKAVNHAEAHIISEITQTLVRRGIAGDDIGIITPYNAQTNIIRQFVDSFIEVQTIDKYQGREKDCIVLSFVLSSNNEASRGSSLLDDKHRINVAITRAKKKLIMVGSCEALSKIDVPNRLIEKVKEKDGIVNICEKDLPSFKEFCGIKRCTTDQVRVIR